MQKSEQIGNLAKALAKVQSGLQTVQKDGTAKIQSQKGNYSYDYLTFGAIWDVCRELLAQNNLAVCQTTDKTDGREVVIETILMHESGEWISGQINIPITQNTPQAVGSAITYGRRYSFAGVVGIVAEEDDDGQQAAKQPHNSQRNSSNQPPPNNVRPISPPPANNKIAAYRKELEGICQQLKYAQETIKTSLQRFDSFKTDEEKYNALVKMREKLAAYNQRYPETENEPPRTIRDFAREQEAKPAMSPRELRALQIFEGLRDEKSEVTLTVRGDGFTLFCPNDQDNWMDFILKYEDGKTSCDCPAFTSITKSKPEFLCEHINGINRYLEYKKALEEAA